MGLLMEPLEHLGFCMTHTCPVRVREEWLRSEALGAALEAGLDIPSTSVPKALVHTFWVARHNLQTGERVLEQHTEAA